MQNTISIPTLQEMLNHHEPVFILDVRPQEQRDEWHIAGSHHINAYDQLKAGDFSVLDQIDLPKNTPVVTVCAAGKTSLIASEALRQKGIEAYSLEGGMKAWNYAWNTAEIATLDFKIIQIRRVAKGCLSYIIGSGEEAVVIDASLDPEVYLSIAKAHGWSIKYAMDTHIHADYLSRTRDLSAASGAQHLFIQNAIVDYPFEPITDGQKITIGKIRLEILHTPGHTSESTSYLVDRKILLTGDTLFTDGVGRPDLKANQEAARKAGQLFDSLQRIKALPPDTLVLPAHISKTIAFDGNMIGETLGELQDTLELLRLPKEAFIAASLKRIPPTPPNYLTIAGLNKQGHFEGHEPAELEAGANRCAVA